jgi:hypothetical protein
MPGVTSVRGGGAKNAFGLIGPTTGADMHHLTPQQVEALRRIPLNLDGDPLDPQAIESLVTLGLVEEKSGGLGLTQKGAITKVMMRHMPHAH